MDGVRRKIYPPRVPEWEDCSSFATWTYFVAGAPDPNGAGYNGSGYTGTLSRHGRRLGGEGSSRSQQLKLAQPGDLVFYGPGWPWGHVSIYIGGGQVVSHGTESGPNRTPIDYRSDRGQIRTYPMK